MTPPPHLPLSQAMRRKPNHVVGRHDYVTMEQCAKIAIAAAERAVAQYEMYRRERRWYRRIGAWLNRLRGIA